MDSEQEARAALADVRQRRESVESELSRNRPLWWMDLLYALGFYLVLASVELGTGLSVLLAGLGFGLLLLAVVLGIRRAARGAVSSPRRVWTPARLAGTVVWLAAMFAVFWASQQVAEVFLPEWAAPLPAAVPAAVLSWFFVRWLGRIGFGRREPAAKGAL
ncbi:hypothetical protein [Streptomonospora wellingtoniae]|uniref:Integral membrane protein n=1 Tax=Streptomonospora wellingtoniae TaxID=3075544 RepID=A0ABU2KS99_9ACTN|nr:hypothetical protein [Streptomonospora sp. DSM 45055]MDT0302008.1 hypothetical protein [Streptomonospora sp. DSM 45055]